MAKPSLALIPSGYADNQVFSVLPSNGDGDFDFTRGSTATRVNAQGLIETVTNDAPRLNYPLLDGVVQECPSLLLEPQRSNLVTNSEDFSNASWTKSETSVSSNSFISPDGTLNAKKITESTSSSKHQIFTTISSYTELTISFFAKKGERSFVSVEKSSWGSTVFDLNNGIVVSGTGNVVYFGNGWYRCSATYTASPSQSQFYILLMEDGSTTNYQGDGTSGLYLWGCQAEVGSYPSSYIPTTTQAVTRIAETCNGAGTSDTFNDAEGVLMVEISALANSSNSRAIAVSDGSGANRIYLFYDVVDNRVTFQIISSTVNTYSFTTILSNSLEFNKFVFKYSNSSVSVWVNGIEFNTQSNVVMPSNLNRLGFDSGSGFSIFNGLNKQIQYFDTALTDSELEKLTSWTSFTDMAEAQLYSVE